MAWTTPHVFVTNEVVTAAQLNASIHDNELALINTARAMTNPANPSGTSSATAVMMGLAATVTPLVTTACYVHVTGTVANDSASASGSLQLRTNTGSAPGNGDVLQGALLGTILSFTTPAVSLLCPFSLCAIGFGFSTSANWIDIALSSAAGVMTVHDLTVCVFELT